jgi:hypothetical protein
MNTFWDAIFEILALIFLVIIVRVLLGLLVCTSIVYYLLMKGGLTGMPLFLASAGLGFVVWAIAFVSIQKIIEKVRRR